MHFDSSFIKEEIRSDFLITEKQKKIWATELQLLEKFDEVCRRYRLTYYADFGTLLGAVRHKGFIPWDDDIDIVMFRDDYMKLQLIASQEFTEPYFYQDVYSDSRTQAFSKLRDSRTAAIQYPDIKDFNQGIFIDIFPLDDVPNNNESDNILEIQRELRLAITKPTEMLHSIENHTPFLLSADFLLNYLKKGVQQQMREFETFCLSHFGQSEYVNYITYELFHIFPSTRHEWYQDIVYLPFEYTKIPAPACYEEILTRRYGDWHRPVRGTSLHENIILDPDVPYTKYIEIYQNSKH